MTDDFSSLIPDAQQFFAELAQDNSKAWFHENKPRYEARLKSPAKALLKALTPMVADLAGAQVKTKLYRAHRDVRFSKDKSPYNLHLHMLWSPQGTGTQPGSQPGYFFGIAPDYVTAGAGIMGFDKAQQAAWRAFVSEREGADLQRKIDAVLQTGGRLNAPELKRVPSPFAADHAHGALLRHKSFVLWTPVAPDPDLPTALSAAFTALNPAMDDLRAFL